MTSSSWFPWALLAAALVAVLALGALTPGSWSPYASGVLIGILSWLAFGLSKRGLGASTTFVRAAGAMAKTVSPSEVEDNEYFENEGIKLDWQGTLLIGLFLGALLSALLGGTFEWIWVPGMWAEAFGPEVWPRLIIAFLGGCLVAVGSRWAGGCTSGHGITQTLQMGVAGWIAAACFFVGGIVTALGIYAMGGAM
jgi:hypothetical protein